MRSCAVLGVLAISTGRGPHARCATLVQRLQLQLAQWPSGSGPAALLCHQNPPSPPHPISQSITACIPAHKSTTQPLTHSNTLPLPVRLSAKVSTPVATQALSAPVMGLAVFAAGATLSGATVTSATTARTGRRTTAPWESLPWRYHQRRADVRHVHPKLHHWDLHRRGEVHRADCKRHTGGCGPRVVRLYHDLGSCCSSSCDQ